MNILTINSHTGWHYLLSKTKIEMDVVGWNILERNIPENFNIINYNNINLNKYDLIIIHRMFNDAYFIIKNILRKKKYKIILVFHGKKQRQTDFLYRKFLKYIWFFIINLNKNLLNINFVFITPCVKESWKKSGIVIEPGIPIDDYILNQNKHINNFNNNKIAIVGNNLSRSHFDIYLIDILVKYKFKVLIIGRNNEVLLNKFSKDIDFKIPNSYNEYKDIISTCGYYFSILKEPEEGYNLSLLEAMATGLPVITSNHPTTPIKNKYNGFVYNDINQLVDILNNIKNIDNDYYINMCNNSIDTINKNFNIKYFKEKWNYVINNS